MGSYNLSHKVFGDCVLFDEGVVGDFHTDAQDVVLGHCTHHELMLYPLGFQFVL